MIIKWRETPEIEHEWEWSGAPRVREAKWIKERTGWTTKAFLDALEDLDPDAVIALICVLCARDGRTIKWDEVDLDPVNDLDFVPTKDELDKVRELEAAQAAASAGKGSIPPVGDLVRSIPPRSSTGQAGNGALAGAALSPRSEPIQPSFGTDSA